MTRKSKGQDISRKNGNGKNTGRNKIHLYPPFTKEDDPLDQEVNFREAHYIVPLSPFKTLKGEVEEDVNRWARHQQKKWEGKIPLNLPLLKGETGKGKN